MTKVIGIDTNSFGFHWVSTFGIGNEDTSRGEKYGWLECKDENVDRRRIETVDYARAFFQSVEWSRAEHDEISIYCEEPISLKNGKTTRLLGLAAGAIFGAYVCSNLDAYWYWVDVAAWKKSVLGRGTRPKDFVSDWPKAKQEKAWIVETASQMPGFMAESDPVRMQDFDNHLDLYDAWAIKTYGVREVAKEKV